MNSAHAAEALLHVGVGLLPGTAPETVAQRLADAVVHLPVPAIAVIGTHPMPADIAAQARVLGEQQGLAAAAEEHGTLFARIWFQPSEVLPAEAETVAIALVQIWEEHVQGLATGLISLSCLPAFNQETWFRGAVGCTSLARTSVEPDGLIPAQD
ncbi:hypothetical protein [Streptomyces sp. NPDC047981]|uniref:hypothetical protein n=1 Tax=Streptomyces sp. NPDC047981 TaxID=3154610 RepID=UPI00341D92B5